MIVAMATLTKQIPTHFFQAPRPWITCPSSSSRIPAAFSFRKHDSYSIEAQKLVDEFDPKIPLEKAVTPPSSWYTDPSFFALELDRVFCRGWQAVGSLPSLHCCCSSSFAALFDCICKARRLIVKC